MMAPDPVVDPSRLQELAKLDLQSERARTIFDSLATEAAKICEMPIGLVSIILDGAQYFLGAHGLGGWLSDVRGTPVEWAFCATVVRTGKELVVSDSSQDPRFSDNPLVTEDGVSCYAGVPLVARNGSILGTLCVISNRAHQIEPERLAQLRALCAQVVDRLYAEALPAGASR